jgi:hypothetical protein
LLLLRRTEWDHVTGDCVVFEREASHRVELFRGDAAEAEAFANNYCEQNITGNDHARIRATVGNIRRDGACESITAGRTECSMTARLRSILLGTDRRF